MKNLLTPEDFEELPDEPDQKFVLLEDILRTRLEAELESEPPMKGELANALALQYMNAVSTLASELEIEGISVPSGDPVSALNGFQVRVISARTKALLRSGPDAAIVSFEVKDQTRAGIREHLDAVENLITELHLSERREKRLRKALIGFRTELDAPRSRFTIGSGHLVTALTVVNLVVTGVAAAPVALKALEDAQSLWGEAHAEVTAVRLKLPYDEPVTALPPPPKQITGPRAEED